MLSYKINSVIGERARDVARASSASRVTDVWR